jgi:ABC-type transporter Mla MlaB component
VDRRPIDCDVSGITEPDELTLETLARRQLMAQRMGTSIRLANASPQLVDLLTLAGLADVLPVACGSAVDHPPDEPASRVEMDG